MSKRSKILVVLGVVIAVVVVGSFISYLGADNGKGSVDVSIVDEADVTSVESSKDTDSSENSDEEKDDKEDKAQDEDEIENDIKDVEEDGIYGSKYNDDTFEKQSSGEYKSSERTGGISKEDRDKLNSMTDDEIKASDKAFHSNQSGSPE